MRTAAQACYLWSDDAKGRAYFYGVGNRLKSEGQLNFLMGGVNPGFNDEGVWGWGNGPRIVDRRGTAEYQDSWNSALDSRPDAIQLITWNDFEEGTTIEPAEQYQFTFIDLTEQNIGAFTGRPVNLEDNQIPFRLYTLRRQVNGLADEQLRADWIQRLDRLNRQLIAGSSDAVAANLAELEKEIAALPKDQPKGETP